MRVPDMCEDNNVAETESVNTGKVYLAVGVVCVVGILLVVANAFAPGGGPVPNGQAAPDNPFKVRLPGTVTPAPDMQRVSDSIADGTEAVSGAVTESASAVKDGIGWVRGSLRDASAPDAGDAR